MKDDRDNYKSAQNIALNIEATVWHAMNKNKSKLDTNYSMKCRELLNYINDDANYELRLHILLGEKKPEFLCQASGKDLLSTELIQKVEKKEQNIIKNLTLQGDVKLVIKSHKGEEIIDTHENIESQKPKEPENNEEEKEQPKTPEPINDEDNSDEGFNNEGGFLDDDFDDVKVISKPSHAISSNSNANKFLDGGSSNFYSNSSTKTPLKNYDEILNPYANAANNKLIDQDLLKTLMNYNFDKIHNTITQRLKQHLKPDITDRIISEFNSKVKPSN